MIIEYRVLLPKWVFISEKEDGIKDKAEQYLQRYPDYLLLRIEGNYAICRRNNYG